MDVKSYLEQFGLNQGNAVVIGSGILMALGLRKSKDIDIVVTQEKYEELSCDERLRREQKHGDEVLVADLLEIMTKWLVIGKEWKFSDLLERSVVIDDVRYHEVEFLLEAKRYWLADGYVRQKDIDDVKLMEEYLSRKGH